MRATFRQIPVADIEPDKSQPRKFGERDAGDDDTTLEGLAQSIAKHGVLEPVIVRPAVNGKHLLIAGERRWRASKMARLDQIPALVTNDLALNDAATRFVVQIEENLQRKALTARELGLAAERLMKELGITAVEVAAMLHVGDSTVARWFAALDPANAELMEAVGGSVNLLEDIRQLPGSTKAAALQLYRKSGKPFSQRAIRRIKDLGATSDIKAVAAAADPPKPKATAPQPLARHSKTAPVFPKGKAPVALTDLADEDLLKILATGARNGYGPSAATSKFISKSVTESDHSLLEYTGGRMRVEDPATVKVDLEIPSARARHLISALGLDAEGVSPLELQVALIAALLGR